MLFTLGNIDTPSTQFKENLNVHFNLNTLIAQLTEINITDSIKAFESTQKITFEFKLFASTSISHQ